MCTFCEVLWYDIPKMNGWFTVTADAENSWSVFGQILLTNYDGTWNK